MKHLFLVLHMIGIIVISGCHRESPISDQPALSPVSSPSDDDPKRKKYAVVIGISNYSRSPLENLPNAVNDALAIETRLESMGFEVKRLLDEKATKENIDAQFKDYKHVNRNSQLVIFYSGHGVTDEQNGYIVSSDDKRIPFEYIRKYTFDLPPKHILYIFDSCHSGFFDPAVQMKWPVRRKNGEEEFVKRESKPAVYTLTAGSSNEEAGEAELEWSGHSYFTHYLLKGLDGVADIDKNCKVTVSELGVYLTQVIPSNKFQQRQNPLFNRVFGEGEITFIPPRCQENQKPELQQQPVPKKKCDTRLFPDKTWETSDAYKGRPAYKEPSQLLLDDQNNLYVLDTPARKVYKFDANGQYIRSYYNENWTPTSMALNNDSSLWVYYSSGERGEIVIYEEGENPREWRSTDSNGDKDWLQECVSWERTPPKEGLIAIDAESNIILADQETGILTKCTIEGLRLAYWGEHEPDKKIGEEINYFETVTRPQGLAVDKFGYIYVADTGGHGIQRYSFDKTWLPGWVNAKGDSPYFFNSPHGIAVDANFHVYIADTDNDRIKKYSVDGKYLLACWGKQRDIDFDDPQGVAVSLDGRFMYVADTGNERIQRFFLSQK
ncbi:MAG: hypothetical protein D3905_04325 [Candidatus Electrothrix sp. AS4_5]|nr:hypothetical protein [Candidatus Electrothrix gigas]